MLVVVVDVVDVVIKCSEFLLHVLTATSTPKFVQVLPALVGEEFEFENRFHLYLADFLDLPLKLLHLVVRKVR